MPDFNAPQKDRPARPPRDENFKPREDKPYAAKKSFGDKKPYARKDDAAPRTPRDTMAASDAEVWGVAPD